MLGCFCSQRSTRGVRGYRSAGNTTRAIMGMGSYSSKDEDSKCFANVNRFMAVSSMKEAMVDRQGGEGGADVEERGDKVVD